MPVAEPHDARDTRPRTVQATVELVRRWVAEQGCHYPGFVGAYLWAGITALPPGALFPTYRDVDVVIVSTDGGHDDNHEVFYQGLMLEVIIRAVDAHRDVEATLASPSSAPNIAATTILVDPDGRLSRFQAAVRERYTEPRWVRARVEAEKRDALANLEAMRAVSIPTDGINHLWLLLNALSGMLAVAGLERPTTRRSLALMHDLLHAAGRSDVHEQALAVWGSNRMTRDDVLVLLGRAALAFDRAAEVYHTPTPMGFTLKPHLRPYLVEASHEMIDQGLHREATFWIEAVAGEAYLTLLHDAPDAEKPLFAAHERLMFDALGYTTSAAWQGRTDAAHALALVFFAVADTMVESHTT